MIPMPETVKRIVDAGHPEIMTNLQGHFRNSLAQATNDAAAGRASVPNPEDYQLYKQSTDASGAPVFDEHGQPQMELNSQIPLKVAMHLKDTLHSIANSKVPGISNSSLADLIGRSEAVPGYQQDLNSELRAASPEFAQANDLDKERNVAQEAYAEGQKFQQTESPAD